MTFNTGGGGGGGVVGISAKLSLCLLYFILAVASGWALKHYSVGRFTLAGYGLFFAHSVLCILRHTHPNPGHVQRNICEQSRLYAPLVFVTLTIGELLSIRGDIELGVNWRSICLGLYGLLLILAVGRRLSSKLKRVHQLCLDVCVLWNVYCLCRIALLEEYYWSLGLALLELLNHFVLWRLTLHFNISQLEVGTVGMCFYVIFAINATEELIEASSSS